MAGDRREGGRDVTLEQRNFARAISEVSDRVREVNDLLLDAQDAMEELTAEGCVEAPQRRQGATGGGDGYREVVADPVPRGRVMDPVLGVGVSDRTLLILNEIREIRAELRRMDARLDREFSEVYDRLRRLDERIDGFIPRLEKLEP